MRGMVAPSTRIGTTRMSRCKAASISRRTKSSKSSRRRRPSSSVILIQRVPITTSITSQDATARPMTSAKSSPGAMESMSLTMSSRPK